MADRKNFKTRLEIAKNKLKNSSIITNNNENSSFIGSAFKLGTELVSAVLVGTIIGFILDTWFDTKPWLIILFFFLGSVAGILNVIKVAKRMQQKD
jgi:ATP synthase protein I